MLIQVGVYIDIIRKILSEFHILNEYFYSRYKSSTTDYDVVFMNWTKDMNKRYNDYPLSMHWATSSQLIAKNQLLLNASHLDEFFCEVKYKFDEKFIAAFPGIIKNNLDRSYEINNRFMTFFNAFDKEKFPKTSGFEEYFQNWKRDIYMNIPGIALDIRWTNKLDIVVLNPVYLKVMLQDDFIMEAKYMFAEIMEEV